MRTFKCDCGAMTFFENSLCLTCGKELGWCPQCCALVALLPLGDGLHRCTTTTCGAILQKCHNYAVENICNRCLVVSGDSAQPSALCDCCRFNETIPVLSVEGNREKWGRLEAAKRRLFYGLNLAKLPYGTVAEGFDPGLSFDFKADVLHDPNDWHSIEDGEQVFTGHANGKVTINIREADDAERERARVTFNEKHRTLIGHFRHEIAHYFWDLLIRGKRESECTAVFGDHENPTYADALERYYKSGPPDDWSDGYVSAYATMHPWEDFAETFATFLDLVSVLDTSNEMGWSGPTFARGDDLETLVRHYQRVGVFMNEMNRAMGLIDYVPEILNPRVIEKMRFIHHLARDVSVRRERQIA